MRPPVAILAASLALLASFAGCGEGGDETGTTTQASTTAQATPQKRSSADDHKASKGNEGRKRSQEGSKKSTEPVNAAPLEVSGGGSEQFKVKGGDNSVQEYGEEADEGELREAAEVVHSFYVARAGEEWEEACAYLASRQIEALKQLASQAPQFKGKGCAALLAALTEPLSPTLQRQATTVDAQALRHEGEQAFLIYTGPPGKTVYSMPMNLEGGAWKVGALSGSALPGT
jgi:hypothetical protein